MQVSLNGKTIDAVVERKTIFGYELKGTSEQLDEMYVLLNEEDYPNPKFQKYFHVWVSTNNTGVYWFPREEFYGGDDEYVFALFRYAGLSVDHSMYEVSRV